MLTNDDYLNIFHEIKNSITLINSSLQLVAKKHPEVQDFDYWKESMSEIDFLKNMVTQLSSARLCGHLSLMQVNLYAFMNQISDSLRLLSRKDFNCELVMNDSLPLIEIDPQLLKQAIVNIVKNACEAMNGSGTVVIHVFVKTLFYISPLPITAVDCPPPLPPISFPLLSHPKLVAAVLDLSLPNRS